MKALLPATILSETARPSMWAAMHMQFQLVHHCLQADMSRAVCNGNGILYDSDPVCHCFDCFTGPTCAELVELRICTIDADGGTPLLYGKPMMMYCTLYSLLSGHGAVINTDWDLMCSEKCS